MKHDLRWQRRTALWGSVAINAFVALAEWVFRPLHAAGWAQPVLAQLNSLAWIAEFPGYLIIHHLRIRHHLSGHYGVSTSAWFVMLAIDLVLWTVALRLLLGILFPPYEPAASRDVAGAGDAATPPAVAATPPADAATPPMAAAAHATRAPALTTRRKFLTNTARVAVAGAAAAGAYSILLETRWFDVTRRRHVIRDLPPELAGLRIVHLTDIHHGPALSLRYVRNVVEATNALHPDVVLMTGDYVHTSGAYVEPVARVLATLRPRIGTFATLGNHDWWQGGPRAKAAFAAAGIPLIDNDRLFLTRGRAVTRDAAAGGGGAGLCIAGVGDLWEDRLDFDRALAGVPDDLPRLLLSHNPDAAEEPALQTNNLRVDLMLCGHTHGGQVSLPFVGPFMIPSQFGLKYASGLVQGPRCPVYVSRGIGTTVLPMRFRVPPEIAVIELAVA